MTFAELKAELADRGFNMLTDARLGAYVNQARNRLDTTERWPYREASVTGPPPISVADLGTIEMVINQATGFPLTPVTWSTLTEYYGDSATVGQPQCYYVAQPNGGNRVVATWPVGGTIGVQYWRRTPILAATGDVPLAPVDYHSLIVDMAVSRAYRDRDNHQAAEALELDIARQLGGMREDLLVAQTQRPDEWVPLVGDDC